jgi:hypothetical protein
MVTVTATRRIIPRDTNLQQHPPPPPQLQAQTSQFRFRIKISISLILVQWQTALNGQAAASSPATIPHHDFSFNSIGHTTHSPPRWEPGDREGQSTTVSILHYIPRRCSQKIQRLRSGSNPLTREPEASMLTTRPPKPSFFLFFFIFFRAAVRVTRAEYNHLIIAQLIPSCNRTKADNTVQHPYLVLQLTKPCFMFNRLTIICVTWSGYTRSLSTSVDLLIKSMRISSALSHIKEKSTGRLDAATT